MQHESDQVKEFILSESYALILQAVWLYGFEWVGLKSVVGNDQIKRTVIEITLIRIFIFSLLIVMVESFQLLNLFELEYLIKWMVFYFVTTLCQNYLYQGLSNNIYLAIMAMLTKGIAFSYVIYMLTLGHTLIGINEILDILIYSSCANALLSNLFIYILVRNEDEHYNFCIKSMVIKVRSGFNFFINNLSVTLMRGINIPLLSVFMGSEDLNLYALVERYYRILQALVRPLNENSIPHVINDFKKNNSLIISIERNTVFQKKINLFLLGFISIISVTCLIFIEINLSDKIIIMAFVMSPSIFFSYKNYFYGLIGLELKERPTLFLKLVLIISAVNFIMIIFLTNMFGIFGAGISYSLSEVFLFLLIYKAIRNA